ncbi:MAG: hypothetical protein V1872_03350 [bacterium]
MVELIKMYLLARFNKASEDFLNRLRGMKKIDELERVAFKIYRCHSIEEIEMLI